MPRPPRLQVSGVYHVTARGNRKDSIYRDDGDRAQFLSLQTRVAARHRWRVIAHCLMTTHFHLLLETPRSTLSAGMHQLNSGYAHYFNERHRLSGHVFERRFDSRLIETEEHMREAISYIALNPVKARLCDHPWEWRWSSFFQKRLSFD